MATATPTKTVQTALLSTQSVAASSVAVSSAFDMSGKIGGGIVLARMGRRSATSAGAGANIRIEISSATSGDNTWFPIAIFTSAFAACESEAVSGTVSSGTNVITVASTTNLTAGDIIFIDNSTIGNSEWGRIKSIVSNTSVTIEDNLVNAQTSSTIYDSAEIYPPVVIPESAVRVRAVADGSSFTQAWAVNVNLVTFDSVTIS